jgi:hypothetical protein
MEEDALMGTGPAALVWLSNTKIETDRPSSSTLER